MAEEAVFHLLIRPIHRGFYLNRRTLKDVRDLPLKETIGKDNVTEFKERIQRHIQGEYPTLESDIAAINGRTVGEYVQRLMLKSLPKPEPLLVETFVTQLEEQLHAYASRRVQGDAPAGS